MDYMVTAGDKNTIPHDVTITDSKLNRFLENLAKRKPLSVMTTAIIRCISVAVIGIDVHYALIREAIVDYMLTAGELTLRHFHMEHTIKDTSR